MFGYVWIKKSELDGMRRTDESFKGIIEGKEKEIREKEKELKGLKELKEPKWTDGDLANLTEQILSLKIEIIELEKSNEMLKGDARLYIEEINLLGYRVHVLAESNGMLLKYERSRDAKGRFVAGRLNAETTGGANKRGNRHNI